MFRIQNPNRNEIAAAISTVPGASLDLPATRFVFVCYTNRCGSAYLGDILTSTGFFGQPFESFNTAETLPCCQAHGLRSFAEYFTHIVRRDTQNDTYIVKVMPEHIALLCETGILDQIIDRSCFLFINRADKLAQAISRAIVEQNRRWSSMAPVALADEQLVYSAERLSQHMQGIVVVNCVFELFFALNGIMPIVVEYERLAEAPQQELDRIAQRMGLHGLRMDASRLRYRRQANSVNQDWRARFLSEKSVPRDALVGDLSMRRGIRPAQAR